MTTKNESLAEAIRQLESGDLGSAHKIAQEHEGDPLADSLHAIIHRREGDYANSLYWWRRVGNGAPAALTAVYGGDPAAFVRRCQEVQPGSPEDGACRQVEQQELAALASCLEAG